MTAGHFDAVVIGGGSAGYAAARTLTSGGAKTAVLEGGREVGGLCILRGCMPTKALLHAAELRQAIRHAEEWGITTGEVKVDVAKLFARKDELIAEFAGYRRRQLETGKAAFIRADARFIDPRTLALGDGRQLTADHFVIATGSVMAPPPPGTGLDQVAQLTSDDALGLSRIPASMIVLGGGAVAVEFAQFFSRFGAQVTIVQRGPHLLRDVDEDVARELEHALRREGIVIHTGTRLLGAEDLGDRKRVRFEKAGEASVVEAEVLFNGLGRTPATAGLGLAAAGVVTTDGRIVTDLRQRTSAPHIFAAGVTRHYAGATTITTGVDAARGLGYHYPNSRHTDETDADKDKGFNAMTVPYLSRMLSPAGAQAVIALMSGNRTTKVTWLNGDEALRAGIATTLDAPK